MSEKTETEKTQPETKRTKGPSVELATLQSAWDGRDGLEVKEQSGFLRIRGAGRETIYVSKGKHVHRIDLSHFTIDHPAVTKLTADEAKAKKLGNVRGQIDMGAGDVNVLAALRLAVDAVAAARPVEKQERAAAKKAPEATTGVEAADPQDEEEAASTDEDSVPTDEA